MIKRTNGWTKALWSAAVLVVLGARPARSVDPGSPRPNTATSEVREPALVVTQAVAALADQDRKKLAAPFGGQIPGWARDWVMRRGRDDLFERKWQGTAVRLPAPYDGADWLGVFSMYHPVEADADHFHLLTKRNGVWSLGAEISEREPASEYRITHHDLKVRLIPAAHRVTVTDRMIIQRLRGARGLLLARMNDDFDVKEARVDGESVAFARAGGLLALRLPAGPPGSLTAVVRYQGTVHHPGMDNVDANGCFLFSYWYPNIARLPATGDLTVTAPVDWTAIAEGEQESRVTSGDEAQTRWHQSHAVCWLQLVAGPYQRTSRTCDDKTLNIYQLRPDPRAATTALNILSQALPFFSRTFAPYPWTHYDVVEYPMTVGALEGYSMTAMSPELLRVALPHELAHTWWGGLVPNTYTVDMWNEAFASYSERLLAEASHPRAAAALRTGQRRARGPHLPPNLAILGATDALDEPEAMVGYRKGAAVLHMFRRTVGDVAFRQSLTRYVTQQSGKASTWRDFQRAAEAVTGRDLSRFFDPWLMRADEPLLRWGSVRQQPGSIDAEIEMTNPAYELHLPVAIDTVDGRRRIATVELSGAQTHFHATLVARAVRLVIDPAADFLLAPADDRRNPWTVELSAASVARFAVAPRHELWLFRL